MLLRGKKVNGVLVESVDGGLIYTGNEAEGETVADENRQGQKMKPADGTVEGSERLKGARAKGEEMADTAAEPLIALLWVT